MSGILNSGKLAKLLTRLGTPASSDVASKIDTLHDTRLTAGRARKLDNLDALISSVGSWSWNRVDLGDTVSSGNWTIPTDPAPLDEFVWVSMIAGGGGGAKGGSGSAGTGGDSGYFVLFAAIWLDPVHYPTTIPWAIGSGGAGSNTNNINGYYGGATSFGNISTKGGPGGRITNTGGADGPNGRWGAMDSEGPAVLFVGARTIPGSSGPAKGGKGSSGTGGDGGDYGFQGAGGGTGTTVGGGGAGGWGRGGSTSGPTLPLRGGGGAGGEGNGANAQRGGAGELFVYYRT